MPRVKTYDLNELYNLVNLYKKDNPTTKITLPLFGKYIRSLGYEIEDHTLRRDNEFREYIKQLNATNENEILNNFIAYKTLDAEAFLIKNNNRVKLKEALIQRDKYYATVASKAVESIKTKKQYENKINELNNEIIQLKDENRMLNEKLSKYKTDNTQAVIVKLKSIITDYIYPDVANSILKREGILDVVNNIVDDRTIDNRMIYADTNIYAEDNSSQINFDSVNDLLGEFDE